MTDARGNPLSAHAKLVQHWNSEGSVRTRTGNAQDVAALERLYGVRLPDDFRSYLLEAAPVSDEDEIDGEFTAWWSLKRIRNVAEEYEHPIVNAAIDTRRSLFFADYMIWSMAWAIDCGDGAHRGKVIVFNGGERFIADSFSAFVDLYLRDIRDVL